MGRRSLGMAVAAILVVAGCGDDYIEDFVEYDAARGNDDAGVRDSGDVTPDSGDIDSSIDEMDAGTTDAGESDAGAFDAGEEDSGGSPVGEPNDTFEDANDVAIGDTINGVMDRAGDFDFYRFEGTQGQWVRFFTNANPTDAQNRTDPMVTLFDAAEVRLAFNDDSMPRINTDSELIVRLPATGTYYLRIQDFEPGRGGPQYTYPLYIVEAGTSTGVFIDPETGDDAESALAIPADGARRAIVGSFRDGTDVDNYSFTITGTNRTLQLYVLPSGSLDYGFTTDTATARLLDGEGNEILSERDWAAFQRTLTPGDYVLQIIAPDDSETDATYGFRANIL